MRLITLTGLAGLAALAACSDGGPASTGRVEFAIATSAATTIPGPAFSENYTDLGGNSLDVDSVLVVVRKLKLEGGPGSACMTDDSTMMDGSLGLADSTDDQGEGEHECGDLRFGPFLVDLPVGAAGAARQFTVTVDTGTYGEVMFQIHKPEGANDATFLAQHPEYAGVSIRVVGSFNGTPFVYTTGVTDVQHVEFDPPLVVGEGGTSFTLFVDLSGWFRTGTGALVDPATAMGDGPNVTLVHQNIIQSFHGFEDEDHDGHNDHEGEGSD